MNNIKWVQWVNRHDVLKAHAIDTDTCTETGVVRTVSGAIVPDSAVDAEDSTPRDEFSLIVLKKRADNEAERAAKDAEKAAAKEAKAAELEAAKAEKAAKKAALDAERAAAKEAKAAEKLAAKEARDAAAAAVKAEKAAATPVPAAEKVVSAEKVKEKKPVIRFGKKTSKVMLGKDVVGEFASEKVDQSIPHVVKVTDKSWAVYQDKKRVVAGLIKPAAVEATTEASA